MSLMHIRSQKAHITPLGFHHFGAPTLSKSGIGSAQGGEATGELWESWRGKLQWQGNGPHEVIQKIVKMQETNGLPGVRFEI